MLSDGGQVSKTDLLWQDDTTGALSAWQMDGTAVSCISYFSPPEAASITTDWKMAGPR